MGGALLFGAAACTDEVKYDSAENVAGEGVYLGADLDTPVNITQDATEVTVPVFRSNAQGTFTAHLESTIVDASGASAAGIFSVPSQVTFADGALEAPLKIGVDFAKVVALEEYVLTLKVKGDGVTPYGLSERDYILAYAPWDDYERYGGLDEFATVTLSAFGMSDVEVAVYRSKSLVSDQERYQFGDYDCPDLNENENDWTSYVNGYNFTVLREAQPATPNTPDLYFCTLQPVATGDTESFGEMVMITDSYTYVKQINPSALPSGSSPENFRRMSTFDAETGLFSINCIYYTSGGIVTQADEYMQLPGFKNYGITFTYSGNHVDIKGNESAIIEAYRTDDVASYTYNLLAGALNDDQIEAAINDLKNSTDTEIIYDQQTNLSFKLSEEGAYTLVAVGYDDASQAVCEQAYTFNYKSVQKESEWESLGYCQYTDGFMYGFGLVLGDDETPIGGETWPVEVQQHKTIKGRYRLVNPYYSWPINVAANHAWSLPGDYYIIFNTANPKQVYIEESEIGMELKGLNWGPLSISSLPFQAIGEGVPLDRIEAAGYFGTNEDGIITFPGWSLLCGRTVNGQYGWYYADGDPGMEFPGSANVPAGTGLTTIDMSGLSRSAAPAKSPAKAINNARVQSNDGAHFHGARQFRATKVDGKTLLRYNAMNPTFTLRVE